MCFKMDRNGLKIEYVCMYIYIKYPAMKLVVWALELPISPNSEHTSCICHSVVYYIDTPSLSLYFIHTIRYMICIYIYITY